MPRLAASIVALLVIATIAPAAVSAAPARVAISAAPATSAATAAVLEGIDVSHWQGTITWSSVAAAGKKFAIIKASEDVDFVDDHYLTNRAGAQAVGIWTGAYHFARPDATANDAINEADHFVATVRLGVHDLIPALDLEDAGGLSVTALQAWVTTWLNRVTARIGIRPMIYVSPAFWTKYMGDTRALADAGYRTLWIAHWGVTSPTVPASNWGGRGWTFWQYSNSGSVAGISGRVDLDRFNGTNLLSQAYSVFSLTAKPGSQVKQGQTGAAATVGIARTNFQSEVALDVSGLPTGASATFVDSPTTDTAATMHVTTDAGSTPTGSYPLTITGSGQGLTKTTTVTLVVADGIPPTLVAPSMWLEPRTTLGSTTVPVFVTWSASDPSGILSYGVQHSINGGAWTTVSLAKPTSTNGYQSLPIGAAVRQQARATDRLANTSGWSVGPSVSTLLTQQTAGSVVYHGTWTSLSTSAASGSSLRSGRFAGASATYTFTGSSVGWVTSYGPDRGEAKVYVDGVYVSTINLQSKATTYRSIVFARNFGAVGSHTVRVVVVGSSGHPRVDVDAFVRLAINKGGGTATPRFHRTAAAPFGACHAGRMSPRTPRPESDRDAPRRVPMSHRRSLIARQTRLRVVPGLPAIRLHLADDAGPPWKATEAALGIATAPIPFWAFAWAGGIALARYLSEHPAEVRRLHVLDFATGSGLVAIAAHQAGAAHVEAADIDPFAEAAVELNARANSVRIDYIGRDLLLEPPPDVDVLLAADTWYESALAERVLPWLQQAADQGIRVLVGDPHRRYLPAGELTRLASYEVETTTALEDRAIVRAGVFTLPGPAPFLPAPPS